MICWFEFISKRLRVRYRKYSHEFPAAVKKTSIPFLETEAEIAVRWLTIRFRLQKGIWAFTPTTPTDRIAIREEAPAVRQEPRVRMSLLRSIVMSETPFVSVVDILP